MAESLGSENHEIADILYYIGIIYYDKEDYDKGAPNFLKAKEIYEKLVLENEYYAYTLKAIGDTFYLQNKLSQACENFQKSYMTFEKIGNNEKALEVKDSYESIKKSCNK
jgi:tetratricopeptide (TPR) repeat protein